jgi:membrane protease YdiL (CAAX protease family)
MVEELLFRGIIFRLLEDWKGIQWAIWGSSVAFGFWHFFGQGPIVGVATMFIGLLFALLRWRSGGIVGLIVLHALWDLETVWLVNDSNAAILDINKIALANPVMTWLGFALLVLVPVYLYWGHPRLERYKQSRTLQ